MRFVEPAGALPMPVLPEPLSPERDRLRAAFVEALDNAHHTHPCPEYGKPYWTGCVHYDETGRVSGVGSCHNERRADAVLVVRDAEVESLRARVAELEAERHSTNEALSDAAVRMRVDRDRIAELEALTPARIQTCRVCGAGYTYGQRCTTCEFKARMASELQARGLDGEHYPLVHHDYRVSHDLPETGGVQ